MYTVKVCFLEIHNDDVNDLLNINRVGALPHVPQYALPFVPSFRC